MLAFDCGDVQMPRQKITFEGHDGGRLAGALEYPDESAKAYVLFAHCFSCGKDIAAASRIARALVARGFAVLRFDFTGLGNSDGDFANTNFSSNVDDLLKAAEYLRNEYRAPSLVIGHSLGGTAALAVANDIPECRGVVTIGAPHDPEHITKHFKDSLQSIVEQGEAEIDIGGRPLTIRKQFVDDVSRVSEDKLIGKIKKALLVFHSPLDDVVSIHEAEKIYQSALHPKSFISLDKADHLLTDKADAEYVASMIAAWGTRYLEEAGVVGSHQSHMDLIDQGTVVVGEHNRQFTRSVQTDNHHWFADEPTSAGGLDLGPDPYEHLLAALGTCTSMTVRMYANRKELPLDGISVTLSHDRRYADDCEGCDDQPRKIDVLERKVSFEGDLNDEQTKKLLEIADKCPVHRTLTNEIRIETQLMSGR